MKLLLLALLILLVSNTIKFVIFLKNGGSISRSSLWWYYFWVGKFPSSHAALFSGVTYGVWYESGFSQSFALCIIISLFVMYTLLENKKRYELLESYYMKSRDEAFQCLVSERTIADFEGHHLADVVAGVVVGIGVAIILYV